MALHDIQRGGITDRIRRFFGVRGQFVAQVDSSLAPVAVVSDLSGQPYDVNAERFVARINATFTGAEAAFRFGIRNQSGNVVVIDDVAFQSDHTVNFGVGAAPSPAPAFGMAALSRDLVTLNVGGFETGTNLAPRPVQLGTYTSATAGANRTTTMWQAPPGDWFLYPVGQVLGADMCAQLEVVGAIAASDFLIGWIRGRIFRDPSLSVTP